MPHGLLRWRTSREELSITTVNSIMQVWEKTDYAIQSDCCVVCLNHVLEA